MARIKKFKPKRGQTDFSKIRWAPVVNCILRHKRKILLVKRNSDMNFYPDCWNGISGFLDDKKNLREKIEEELKEELGISKNNIKSIRLGEIFNQEAPEYQKTWIVHPVLVEVKTDKIRLDWEAQDFKWLFLSEIKKFKLSPGLKKVLRNTLVV
jgi:ADP-ribose pyrophosphatase YjhB (NUDIX family)